MTESGLIDAVLADRYRVDSRLGEGAMGDVYLAEDLQLRRMVAVKVLRKEWLNRPEVVKRLDNECRIMAHLGPHTNIITLYDRLEHEGNAVLVLEYVPGETLADVIERTQAVNEEGASKRKTTPVLAGLSTIILTPDEALRVADQCLSALEFTHSKGILHRDIKPSNIMVARDHNGDVVAKVMDFGIGKLLSDPADDRAEALTALTQTGGPGPGTPAYMAPEQIDASRFGDVVPATDLYAMAVTLFEMLTLSLPFNGSYTELLHSHTNVEPPDVRQRSPQVSPAVACVLAKALKKSPTERYQSAQLFRAELKSAMAGKFTGGSGKSRSSSLALVAGGAAAVCLIGGFGAFLYPMLQASDSPGHTVPNQTAPVSISEPINTATPELPQTGGVGPTAPAPEVVAARSGARQLQGQLDLIAQQRGEPVPDSTEVNAARQHMQAADSAFGEGKYEEAQVQYAKASENLQVALNHMNASSLAKAEAQQRREQAQQALGDAEQRFSNSDAELFDSPQYSSAITAMDQGESALQDSNWSSASESFASASTMLAAINPPAPTIQPSMPQSKTTSAAGTNVPRPASPAPAKSQSTSAANSVPPAKQTVAQPNQTQTPPKRASKQEEPPAEEDWVVLNTSVRKKN